MINIQILTETTIDTSVDTPIETGAEMSVGRFARKAVRPKSDWQATARLQFDIVDDYFSYSGGYYCYRFTDLYRLF